MTILEEMKNETTNVAPKVPSSRPRPERRRKTKMEIFKETTLPLIIVGVAAIFILTFIIGSIVRGVQKRKAEEAASIAASEAVAEEESRLSAEVNQIISSAEALAASYDYDEAIAMIDSFSGNIGGYPELQDARVRYEFNKGSLVPWEDPNTIINLSFQTLIADPVQAFSHAEEGSTMRHHYITVNEFQSILERLYANDYILVGLKDFVQTETDVNGQTVYKYKELMLPEGKKPIVLTQTNVNYVLELVDSDGDMIADQGGAGVASKLVLSEDGSITCEMVDSEGSTIRGAYDLIPILDAFVKEHPDFSYRGAKAVLGLTGFDGLFGYRTDPDGRETFGEESYQNDVATVQAIADVLRNNGYELGCYTYENRPYGVYALSEIQADQQMWNDEVVPVLGAFDVMVFAQTSDINSGMLYTGEKYEYLKSIGYNYFLGFATEGDSFTFIADEYIRQGRILVTGNNLENNTALFNRIFDTEDLLDPARG